MRVRVISELNSFVYQEQNSCYFYLSHTHKCTNLAITLATVLHIHVSRKPTQCKSTQIYFGHYGGQKGSTTGCYMLSKNKCNSASRKGYISGTILTFNGF